jgi:hypothetical protein
MTLLLAGALFVALQPANPESSDGFYCATDRYLAFETLVHDSPAPHLLHVVSLDDRAGTRAELTVEVAAEPARRMTCASDAVIVQGQRTTSVVDVNLRSWRATLDSRGRAEPDIRWAQEPLRLWGTGVWTTTAIQRVPLRRYDDGARVSLEIVRLSVGGSYCHSDAGARIVWLDPRGRETQARAIFLRQADCRRAGLKSVPPIDDCTPQPGRVLRTFHGRVKADQSYSETVAPFRIALTAEGHFGWTIGVRPIAEDRELTSMIPLHGRSDRDIRPDDVIAQTWLERQFRFHPDMGKTIVYHDDAETMLVDDLRVGAYGRGRLTIERYSLGTDGKGQPRFEWIEFRGCVSWPK